MSAKRRVPTDEELRAGLLRAMEEGDGRAKRWRKDEAPAVLPIVPPESKPKRPRPKRETAKAIRDRLRESHPFVETYEPPPQPVAEERTPQPHPFPEEWRNYSRRMSPAKERVMMVLLSRSWVQGIAWSESEPDRLARRHEAPRMQPTRVVRIGEGLLAMLAGCSVRTVRRALKEFRAGCYVMTLDPGRPERAGFKASLSLHVIAQSERQRLYYWKCRRQAEAYRRSFSPKR